MNETTLTGFDAVKSMNQVDGFDPTALLRRIVEPATDGTVSERFYLDVAYRKLWFRLKHPEGAIRKVVREITDQFAIVEAKVYLDRNDPPDSFIANAIVKRYYNPEDRFGDKYLELAETAAVGRALADAGFGVQFGDTNEPPDPTVVDSPVGLPNGAQINSITGEVMPPPQPAPPNPVATQNTTAQQPPAPAQVHQASSPSFTPDMPVETILAQMTLDYAINLTVDCGYYKGQKLGQVANDKPSSLDWYVTSYKGYNNILRAAAQYLLNRAAAG